jgi:hypothetical protein
MAFAFAYCAPQSHKPRGAHLLSKLNNSSVCVCVCACMYIYMYIYNLAHLLS